MTREAADVVVVGGGIVGITIAFHLARARAGRIVLCERRTVGSGTSAMSGAMCGQQAEVNDTISRLAHRAREIYQRFGDVVGGDCGFTGNGIMGLRADLGAAGEAAAAAARSGSDVRVLTAREARAFYPEVNTDGMDAAVLFPATGSVDAYATMRSYLAGARRLGADVREFTPVTRIDATRGRIVAVHTPQATLVPGKVVLACGPWSHKVAALAGLHLPIQPTQVGVAFYRRPPDFYPRPPVLGAELSIIPWRDDQIRVLRDTRNPLVRIEPDPTDAVCPQWMVEHASDVIHHRLPKMRHGRFQGAYQTCYDDTPDLMPLLGDAPGYENLFLDCGWSGRGFKFSVALGEYLVPWILEGKTGLDLAPWLATRFGAPSGA
jgi:sarcosine oxidase subunit beta